MRRWLVLLAVLSGCAEATTDPVQMSLDADAGVDTGAAAPDAKLFCGTDGEVGDRCIVNGARVFKGRYACAYTDGAISVGCTYTDGGYLTLVVASCAECQ